MGCPHVRGNNPRALANGLSYVQVDKHGKIFYTTYNNVDIAHHEIFRANVCKGGIIYCQIFVTLHQIGIGITFQLLQELQSDRVH